MAITTRTEQENLIDSWVTAAKLLNWKIEDLYDHSSSMGFKVIAKKNNIRLRYFLAYHKETQLCTYFEKYTQNGNYRSYIEPSHTKSTLEKDTFDEVYHFAMSCL
ncbi:hypothetical protein D3C81_767740 [compost metagenome]